VTLLWLLASAALLAAVVRYAWRCWAHPFIPCRRCAGSGRKTSLILRRPESCHHCHGTGARVRLGRRVHTHLADVHERGTR
jgi:hypothetical protein